LEAVNAATQLPYDVILMDVLMPALDGLDATRRIRELLPKERQPRIIAMTANALTGDRERCLAAGADDYISKPIQLSELAKVIERNQPGASGKHLDTVSVATPGVEATSGESAEIDSVDLDQGTIDILVSAMGHAGAAIVLGAMIDSAPNLLEGLRQSLATSDQKECRRHAHSLKANAKTVGAYALARRFEELESLADSGRLHDVTSSAEGAVNDYRKLIESARRVRKEFES
jgi:CheY-like chemotaxis protein